MKRITALFLALLVAGAVFSGCGTEDSTSASQGESQMSSQASEPASALQESQNSSQEDSALESSGAGDTADSVDTSGWTEREYRGVRFLLPEEWTGSASNMVFFGPLSNGESATLFVSLRGLKNEFSWEEPEDWETVKVRLNQDAAEEEDYEEIACEESEVCGQTGLFRHFRAVVSGSEFEVKTYSTVVNGTIVTFRTTLEPDAAEEAKAELDQIAAGAMASADFSGME